MRLPSSFKNWLSIAGAVIAIFNLAAIFALVILNWFFNVGGTYIGLFIYIVLPAFLIAGLILIPVGRAIQKRREKRTGLRDEMEWPVVDLNKEPTRNAALIFIVGTVFLLIISSIGSYEAYHYTESVEFCGKLCHKVMEPEYTAYHQSSHERVKCVECHVGSGASWYVKSKMSGLYQVYSVLFNKYPRPIPTPIHNLRPARETCEECHWTEKFYDRKMITRRFYMADDSTSEWDITLLMKTSATYSALGLQEGIHWHINPNVKVEYKLDTADASIIPWVKFTNAATGETRIYKDPEFAGDTTVLYAAASKTMDCMDCHNRPSHNYKTPQRFVDEAITAGDISRTLPGIKAAAMSVLHQDFATKDSAFMAIEQHINAYYADGYPEIAQSGTDDIKKAIAAIQKGYGRNIFPEMKVKWDKYPLHQSHMESNGCFRCHNNRNVSDDGHTISRDCQLCHSILSQGKPGQMEYSNSFETLEFRHPVDIDNAWQDTFCSECHSALF